MKLVYFAYALACPALLASIYVIKVDMVSNVDIDFAVQLTASSHSIADDNLVHFHPYSKRLTKENGRDNLDTNNLHTHSRRKKKDQRQIGRLNRDHVDHSSSRKRLPVNIKRKNGDSALASDQDEGNDSPPQLSSSRDPEAVIYNHVSFAEVQDLCKAFINGRICRDMRKRRTPEEFNAQSRLVNVTFGCHQIYRSSWYGTGNFISTFYVLRMVAHALGQTDVVLQCVDAEEQKKHLVLPWLMGIFPRLQPGDPDLDDQPSIDLVCSGHVTVPMGYRYNDMMFELRRMAIAMVGIPSLDHPSALWSQENLWAHDGEGHYHGRDYYQLAHPRKDDKPLFPHVELDDAVLHFRCGDIIDSRHGSYGFMKFESYARYISQDVRTIGIVTQPFEASAQQRSVERAQKKLDRCKLVVHAFVQYLHHRFPRAKVSVRNDVEETIALSFARIIMANETVIGISSFGVFPGLTTFGTAYIRDPDYEAAPNRWLRTSSISEKFRNVKFIKEPKLLAPHVQRLWGEDGSAVLEWFQSY